MTSIPDKKRSDDELQDIRRQNAFAVRPPVQQLQNQALPKVVLGFCYLMALLAAACLVFARFVSELVESIMLGLGFSLGMVGYADESILGGVYYGSVICGVVSLLMSLWIFWKKPRSRHHAALLLIMSLLVVVFGSLSIILP